MTKDAYGLFSYANSFYSIALLFTGFGMVTAVLQYCAEKRSYGDKSRYYRYGLTRGLAVDAVIVIVLFAVVLFVALPIEDAGLWLAALAPMLLVDYVFQFEAICLRSRKDNRRFSRLQVVQSVLYGGASCLGAWAGGIGGLIIGRYIAYVLSAIYGAMLLRRLGLGIKGASPLSRSEAVGMWRFSLENGAAGVMIQLVYLIDVAVVGLVLADAQSVASYRVATMLPEGFLFVPASILVFAGPYFVEHNDDMGWFRRNALRLFGATEAVMAVIALALIMLAEPVVVLLWGEAYLDAVPAFRVVAASLMVSPLRSVCVNLLGALRMTRENLIISAVTLVVNVAAVLLLTQRYGIVGAAWAVLVVAGVAAVLSAVVMERKTRAAGPAVP